MQNWRAQAVQILESCCDLFEINKLKLFKWKRERKESEHQLRCERQEPKILNPILLRFFRTRKDTNRKISLDVFVFSLFVLFIFFFLSFPLYLEYSFFFFRSKTSSFASENRWNEFIFRSRQWARAASTRKRTCSLISGYRARSSPSKIKVIKKERKEEEKNKTNEIKPEVWRIRTISFPTIPTTLFPSPPQTP